MTSNNAPDLWYNYLMFNNLQYRYEPSSIASSPAGDTMPAEVLYSKNPTPDGSMFLQGARTYFAPFTYNSILTDLENLESYIHGLNIEPDHTSSKYGTLFYDPTVQNLQQSSKPREPNYFEPDGVGGSWGMFVSGADQYNQELKNQGKSSLFSVISPMPVVYDGKGEPEYNFYIPEFDLRGSHLNDFLENTEPLPYDAFPQKKAPANAAEAVTLVTLRPHVVPTEPTSQGYYCNKYFTYSATNGAWGQSQHRIINRNPASGPAQGTWANGVLNDIGQFRTTILSLGQGSQTFVTGNQNVACQYDTYTNEPGVAPGKLVAGYYGIPSTSFQCNNGTNIYLHDTEEITIRNTNPYLNLLYLKLDIGPGGTTPGWWNDNTAGAVPPGIPIYQGEPENKPISFERKNLINPSDGSPLIPEGGGLWCLSPHITSGNYRLLMIFNKSYSNPSYNRTLNIVPQSTPQQWPVSIGPFYLNLSQSIGGSTWQDAFQNANLEVSLLDQSEGENYAFGLNYLDINGAYLQTPLVGDTYEPGATLPAVGSSIGNLIDPYGQQPYNYYIPLGELGPVAAQIDWSKGFDCGLGKPEYGINGGEGGYGYGYLNEDIKQTQDLKSINILYENPVPLPF